MTEGRCRSESTLPYCNRYARRSGHRYTHTAYLKPHNGRDRPEIGPRQEQDLFFEARGVMYTVYCLGCSDDVR